MAMPTAAEAAAKWAIALPAAQSKFARNSAAVTLQAWQQATTTKGAQRLSSGAQAAQSKVEATFAKLFPAIQSAVSSLPPRGDIEANIARSAAFARAMNKYKTAG